MKTLLSMDTDKERNERRARRNPADGARHVQSYIRIDPKTRLPVAPRPNARRALKKRLMRKLGVSGKAAAKIINRMRNEERQRQAIAAIADQLKQEQADLDRYGDGLPVEAA